MFFTFSSYKAHGTAASGHEFLRSLGGGSVLFIVAHEKLSENYLISNLLTEGRVFSFLGSEIIKTPFLYSASI